ncbi:MAG: hypothetical protein QNJ54_04275 [Prochloraceae cyanobacterium]|nr:hypothetical protein [Prochloraceae cyanobacterium]
MRQYTKSFLQKLETANSGALAKIEIKRAKTFIYQLFDFGQLP